MNTSMPANKSPNILNTQNVTIDSTQCLVPNQLITWDTKIPIVGQVQDRNGNFPCWTDPYFRPPPRPPDNL